MTYKQKYDALITSANIAWKKLYDSGHWDDNKTVERYEAFERWQKISNEFIEFDSQIKKGTVNMYDQIPD